MPLSSGTVTSPKLNDKHPINKSDKGLIIRNYQNAVLLYILIFTVFKLNFKKVNHVDYAGGYGILVRILRDLNIRSYWYDKYCVNLFSEDYNWEPQMPIKIDLISAFEVFEHFENPILEIDALSKISKNIIFTTRIIGESIPGINDWWYYGVEHGQHIGFFRKRTLFFLSERYSLNIYSDGVGIHLLTEKKIQSLLFFIICKFSKFSILNILKRL